MNLRSRTTSSTAAVFVVLAIVASLAPTWAAAATATATPVPGVPTRAVFDVDAPFTFVSSEGRGEPHVDTTHGLPASTTERAAVEDALDFRIVEAPAHMAYATSGSSFFWRGGNDDLDVHLRTLSEIPDEAVLVIKSVFEDLQDTIDMEIPNELWHEIDVNWDTSLPNGVLAGASTWWVTVNQDGNDFMIPLALYEILGGPQSTNNAPAMSITINANAVWDMALQPSNQGINEYYLKTVLLHEVTHGLGFTSGVSELGSADAAPATPWSSRVYGQQNLSLPLLDHGRSILQSNNLWLHNSDGTWERLFDPSPWQTGSSLSHLNETTYPYSPGAATTPGALMTPYLQRGETSTLDGVVIGVLARLGYTSLLAPLAPSIGASHSDGVATITIDPATAGASNVPAETWTVSIISSANSTVAEQVVPATQRTVAFGGLAPSSTFTARVIAATDGQTGETSVQFATASAPTTTVAPVTAEPPATTSTTLAPSATPPDNPALPTLIGVPASSCLGTGSAQPFDLSSEAIASLYRLYCAHFLRVPDAGGFAYWVQENSNGTDLRRISDFFAGSDEFSERYGKLTDQEYVQLTYANVLERRPDAKGYAYWVARLAAGLSRGDMTLYFSDSAEFRQRTQTG